jgi:S1-C subfamily serine protease
MAIRLPFARFLLPVILSCASAGARAESLAAVFERVSPAVVVVRTSGRTISPRSRGRVVSAAGIGSGVLVDPTGKVVTAAHVVQTADAVAVEFPGDVLVNAQVVAADAAADVALLQVERVPSGIIPAVLGDSDGADVGEQVFVVGAPFGISHTLTVGYLSARRELDTTYGAILPTEFFQTDAAINEGNSGGPMFNLDGEVIGIVSHIVSKAGAEGLGFVVTSNMARRLLLDEQSVWSGLEGYLLGGDVAAAFNIPAKTGGGLLVQRVAEGSPAERLGLRGGSLPIRIGDDYLLLGGDVVLSVDGIALGDAGAYEDIRQRLIEARKGRPLKVTVLRAGEIVELLGAVDP